MTTVVGGVYGEICVEPFWDDTFGSAGRAAAAISSEVPGVKLHTYITPDRIEGLNTLEMAYGLSVCGPRIEAVGISFHYMHPLADPRIIPPLRDIGQHPDLVVDDDVVLRFGMLEGTAKVSGRRVVYDPQSAFDPRPFDENGSHAAELALILNRFEGQKLTGQSAPGAIIEEIFRLSDPQVIVLKMGSKGAIVATREGQERIPAYRSSSVWKLGSGDIFSAAFTLRWAVQGLSPVEAADQASRSVSHYVETRYLRFLPSADLLSKEAISPGHGQIYIAGPFFNLAEIWMIEETRKQLLLMGVRVFSPLHDVGRGPASLVTKKDLEGIDQSDVVLAILNGQDTGTIFEIGYAVANKKPVVALAQNVRPEDLKMIEGSDCQIVDEFATAIYQAVWALR